MSSLSELPPLPASLSSLLEAAPTGTGAVGGWQRRQPRPPGAELHNPLPPNYVNVPIYSNVPLATGRTVANTGSGSAGVRAAPAAPLPQQGVSAAAGRHSGSPTQLQQRLELLRQQMGDLRQLDLSLLNQLWSLNEAIHEWKQLARSPSWDNGYDGSADEEEPPSSSGSAAAPHHAGSGSTQLASVSERLSPAGSSSSLEYGDI